MESEHRALTPSRGADALRVMGCSCLLLSSLAIGAVFAGVLASGHEIIPILIVTAVGTAGVAIGEGILRRYRRAWSFGGFAGFNATWALLQLGMWHGWYGIAAADVPRMMEVYLATWALLFVITALAELRDDPVISLVFGLGVAGLLLDFASYAISPAFLHVAAVPIFAISLVCLVAIGRARIISGGLDGGSSEGATTDC